MICVNEQQQDRRFCFPGPAGSYRCWPIKSAGDLALLGLSCVCDIFIPLFAQGWEKLRKGKLHLLLNIQCGPYSDVHVLDRIRIDAEATGTVENVTAFNLLPRPCMQRKIGIHVAAGKVFGKEYFG